MRYGKYHANRGYCGRSSIVRSCCKKASAGNWSSTGTVGGCADSVAVISCNEKHKRTDDNAIRNSGSGAGGIESGNQNGRDCYRYKISGGDMPRCQRRRDRFFFGNGRRCIGARCVCSVDRSRSIYDWRVAVKRFCLLSVVLIIFLTGQASAISGEEVLDSQIDALGLDDLRRAAQEYAPDFDWNETPDFNEGLNGLLEKGSKSFGGMLKQALHSCVLLLAIVLFGGIAEGLINAGTGKGKLAIPIASSLAITSVAVNDAKTLIGFGSEMIREIEAFTKVLLPTMAAVTAASGSPAAAAAKQLAAMLFSDVLVSLIHRFLLPLVYTYIAVCTAHAALGNEGLKRIAGTLKWVVTSVLTMLLIAFVGYLSVSGVIAGTTDAITLKAAKFTVSSVVPVVGGILSDAAETVLVGAGMLKNSVGVFGMLVVLGMSIVPFLQLGIHYLAYKMTATLTATVADSRISGLIDGISSAFGLVLGMCGACALLLLISMISAIKVTGL